jgi:chorismate dehydratase
MEMDSKERDGVLIGKIKYSNAWPLYHHFHVESLSRKTELVTEVPAVLNKRILEGSLDISPVSSFAFGLGAEELLLLPDLSVSSNGPVNSILLFSRKPPEQLHHAKIALSNTSATSVNLLKIVMEKAYEVKPTYTVSEPILEDMMSHCDAALLIGDHAIRASWLDHGYIVTDLGKVWKEWTGYGMTFAVWTVQRQFAEQNSVFLSEVCSAFQSSKKQSLHNLSQLVDQACQEIGGTGHYWHHYFNNLCYDFKDDQAAGLALYFSYAYDMGLLPKEVQMDIWCDNKLTRVK